jgi:hypothetical protein
MHILVSLYLLVFVFLSLCKFVCIYHLHYTCRCTLLRLDHVVSVVSRLAPVSRDVVPTSKYFDSSLDGG